jgi:alpha-beta hydrolase superfamily lysophospholipase
VVKEAGRRYPGRPQFFYGHSLGGSLVLYYILSQKPCVRGAIVTGPGLATHAPVGGLKLAAGQLLYKLMPSFTFANGLDLNALSSDPTVVQHAKSDPYYHTRVSARLGLDAINQGEWLQIQTGPVPVPLLIMQGTADRVSSLAAARRFAKNITGDVTYREWDGWYHELHNEPGQAELFKASIAWLDAQLTRTSSSTMVK